mmetsp:Transcript_33799/g.61304  ORF Transcript_33799/g.61304 Transcript_33799/m.61304 type:complete len:374 (+) Transcript_33799:15-1136(+)
MYRTSLPPSVGTPTTSPALQPSDVPSRDSDRDIADTTRCPGRRPQVHCGDDLDVTGQLKILSYPGHYMNHEPCHLINPSSVEYWASLPGHIREQAFEFEMDSRQVLSRVEWKDRGDGMGVARLTLEAQVERRDRKDDDSPGKQHAEWGEEWQKLSTWPAVQTSCWQVRKISMAIHSRRWKLTFLQNNGDENHLVVQAVRFFTKPAAKCSSPAQNMTYTPTLTRKLWGDVLFTDAEVICGDRRFSAHRAVLAAASPVFSAMLSTEMKEGQAREIVISDSDEQSVLHVLEYIYTGCVAERAGCGMVVLGHKYDIDGIVEYAAPVALGNLTTENCISEVRILRAYADDPQLGPVFEALQNKIHEIPELFKAMMLGI